MTHLAERASDDEVPSGDVLNEGHNLVLGPAMIRVTSGIGALAIVCLAASAVAFQPAEREPSGPPGTGWQLVFDDSFDGSDADADLDTHWQFQNGPSGHILSSRWRDNVQLEDGILKLIARKEQRAGQDWTSANLWTKQEFQYGYVECRYRYAAATGTNNSFWLMSNTPRSKPGRFEIDINEGHYPYEVNMNLHQHSGQHWAKGGRWYYYGAAPYYTQDDAGWSFVLEQPVTTSKLRLVSNDADIVRIMEWRVFPPSADGYPSVFPNHRQTEARLYHDILCEQFENPEMILQNAGTWTEDRVHVGD